MIERFRFKKLLNEYKSSEYELKMVREILKDAHLEFEVYYRQYCAERDIDLAGLNESNREKVDVIFEKQEQGLVPTAAPKEKKSKHKDVYRSIAKKIHPDKLDSADSRYWQDYMDFKDATRAMSEGRWGTLFDIADRHKVYMSNYDEICSDIEQDLANVNSLIRSEKASFSWKLHECENEPCKNELVKSFLHQLFGWKE
jgi:hypothetical protein